MFKLRAVIHCPGFLHGTSCTCLAAVSLAIYQCDGAKLASAALGIGLIAFINQRLIETADTSLLVLPEFLGLLLLLMAVTLGSQLALTTLGHHFVYRLRSEFIKRILDTHVERIEQLGSASLLAGLTSDVRNITIAFVRLPELVAGDHSHYRFRGVSVDAVGQNVAGNGYLDGDHHLGRFCAGGAGVQTYGDPA